MQTTKRPKTDDRPTDLTNKQTRQHKELHVD